MRSSEAFVPYSPLNVLKPVADNVWIVDGPEIRFSYLGPKFPCRLESGEDYHCPRTMVQRELRCRVAARFAMGSLDFWNRNHADAGTGL